MAVKKYKPTSAGRRGMTGYSFDELTTDKPHKALLKPLKNKAGRNNAGRISVRHRGGGHKRRYRLVDFVYSDKMDIPATVKTIEYDPNRTAYIALVEYADNEKRYVIAYKDMKVGDVIITTESTKPTPGNRMKVRNIPVGMQVHNVEIILGKGAAIIRSAGSSATIISQEGDYTLIKLPSNEVRKVHKDCFATMWVVSNADHSQIVIGKAGRARWKGRRPTVLGKSMNPVDHPHGGGEGHVSLGGQPMTPWGKPALGVKTRRNKQTNRWIATDKHGSIVK